MSDRHAEVIGCSRSLLPICNLWRVKDSAQMCSQTGNPQHFSLSVPSKITSCFTDQRTYHINIMKCCDIILFVKIFLLTKCGGTAASESGSFFLCCCFVFVLVHFRIRLWRNALVNIVSAVQKRRLWRTFAVDYTYTVLRVHNWKPILLGSLGDLRFNITAINNITVSNKPVYSWKKSSPDNSFIRHLLSQNLLSYAERKRKYVVNTSPPRHFSKYLLLQNDMRMTKWWISIFGWTFPLTCATNGGECSCDILLILIIEQTVS